MEGKKQSILGTRHFFDGRTGKGVNSLSCRGVGSSAVRKVLGRDHLLSRDWISPRLDQRLGLIKISLWVGGDSRRRHLVSPRLASLRLASPRIASHCTSPRLLLFSKADSTMTERMVWGKYAVLPLPSPSPWSRTTEPARRSATAAGRCGIIPPAPIYQHSAAVHVFLNF